MRHEDRHRHLVEHQASGAAENEFTQAAVAIGAHHQKPGTGIGGALQQRRTGIDPAARQAFGGGFDSMPGQRLGEIGAGNRSLQVGFALRIDPDETHRCRRLEERQRIEDGAGGFAMSIPADDDLVELELG